MNIFSNIWLVYPFIFIIGIFVILLGVFFLYTLNSRQNFTEKALLQEVFQKTSLWYRLYVSSLLGMSITLLIYISGPYLELSQETITKNGIDIEIVLDLSYSMIAEDIMPSRLEVAKEVFKDFIWELKTDRVGLVLFSGKPFQSVPLTYDYQFLSDFVSEVSVDIIDQRNPRLQGTAIGDAIVLWTDILIADSGGEREKVMILITDGEANRGVEPILALKLLKEEGIKTYTIWVWKDEATTIKAEIAPGVYQRIEIWGIDEEILKKIADETWWEYYRADSKEAFKKILERIGTLEKKEIETDQIILQNSLRPELSLLLMFLSLILGVCIFIKNIKYV